MFEMKIVLNLNWKATVQLHLDESKQNDQIKSGASELDELFASLNVNYQQKNDHEILHPIDNHLITNEQNTEKTTNQSNFVEIYIFFLFE